MVLVAPHATCYFMLRHAHNVVCADAKMHADGAGQHAPPPESSPFVPVAPQVVAAAQKP